MTFILLDIYPADVQSLPADGQPSSADGQPSSADVQPSSVDNTPDQILDSQGLIKLPDPPVHSSQIPVSSATQTRSTRRTPAPLPEALTAACLRKPTSPVLVPGNPCSAGSSVDNSTTSGATPMDLSTPDLKRKAQTQTDAVPKEKREKKKKGKKC